MILNRKRGIGHERHGFVCGFARWSLASKKVRNLKFCAVKVAKRIREKEKKKKKQRSRKRGLDVSRLEFGSEKELFTFAMRDTKCQGLVPKGMGRQGHGGGIGGTSNDRGTLSVKTLSDDKAPQQDGRATQDLSAHEIPDVKAAPDVNSHTTPEMNSQQIPDAKVTSEDEGTSGVKATVDGKAAEQVVNVTVNENTQEIPNVKAIPEEDSQVIQKATLNAKPEPILDASSQAVPDAKATPDMNSQVIPDIKATTDMNSELVQDVQATLDVNTEATADTNCPTTNAEPTPEKIEDGKEIGPSFHCDLCDAELVHKVAQAFFAGLATACIDNTTADMFRSAGSVAADIRKEMIDYLNNRSENFVAESVVLEGGGEGEVSDHPFDILTEFIDDFAATKRNLMSRVSGWLLSEKREDKIDDFVQEMEISGFWPLDKREQIAQMLIRNVDFKNGFHCDLKFNSSEDLAAHVISCSFRSINCTNEGCSTKFSANQLEKHDSVCPFKIIPCEQNCPDSIMRREMDRHCITVCLMKLVSCPFFPVGCQLSIPYCKTREHCSEKLQVHLLYILKGIHKEVHEEDLMQRVNQLEQSSFDRLEKAQDVLRSLTFTVKDLDAKLGPIEVKPRNKVDDDSSQSADKAAEEATDSTKKVDGELVDSTKRADDECPESTGGAVDEATDSSEKVDAGAVRSTKEVDEAVEPTRKVDDGESKQPMEKVMESTNSPEKVDHEDIHSTMKVEDEAIDLAMKASDQANNLTKEVDEEAPRSTNKLEDKDRSSSDQSDEAAKSENDQAEVRVGARAVPNTD